MSDAPYLTALLPADHVRPSVAQLVADGSISTAHNAQLTSGAAERAFIHHAIVQSKLASFERELTWQAWPRADEVAALLADEGEALAADKLRTCHDPDNGWLQFCPTDPDHYKKFHPARCWLRTCPSCAKAIAQRLRLRYAARIQKVIARPVHGWTLKHVVLTMRREGELTHQVSFLHLAAKRLVKHFWGDDKRAGAFAALEIGPRGGNVHVHAIVYGGFVAQAELSDCWLKLTSNPVVWIERIEPDRAVGEGIKYCTKFANGNERNDFELSSADLVSLHLALKGKRRVWAWGAFYGLDDDIENDPEPSACPECAARLAWSSRAEVRSILNLTSVINCTVPALRSPASCGPPAVGPPKVAALS